MKAHSNEFKTNIARNGKEITSKITYQDNGETIELGDEELNSITPHYKGDILKSVMKQLDIDSNEDIPVGTEVNYQFGLKVHEPYDEPFEIIGSTSQVTTEGKNLLNTNNVSGTYSTVVATYDTTDKSITLNGTASSNYTINIITNWSLELPAGTYTLSGCADMGGKETLSIELYSNSPNNKYFTDIGAGATFTTTETRTFRCYIAIKSGKRYDNVKLYPMLEIGNRATEYEPYTHGPTPNPYYPQPVINKTGNITEIINNEPYNFNLGNIELCKIGDYQDVIFKNETTSSYYNNTLDLNAWYIKKNIGKYTLDTLQITLQSQYTNIEYGAFPKPTDFTGYDNYEHDTIYCNKAVLDYTNTWDTSQNINKIYSNAKKTNWWLGFSKGTGLDNIKTQLSGTVIYYLLATPTYTKITDETLLEQFKVVETGYEYLNYGNYIVKESEKQEDVNSYKITCYDKMLYSMVDYEDMEITYPITIRNYITAICTKFGLTFANANDTFVNYDKQISSELYLDDTGNTLNYTFRDVLDELAQVTASTICINNNDELEIRYITDTNDTIDEDYFKDTKVDFGEKYGPINSIVLSRSAGADNIYEQDDESVEENGLCELRIEDNQILNGNDRDEYLQEIFNQLNGLEYYVNDYASYGIMYYELCDKYTAHIDENNYTCLMLNDEIIVQQGLEENIHTDMPITTETEYKYADNTDKKINKAYIIVDKQNAEITSLSSRTQTLENDNIQIKDKFNDYTPVSRTVQIETSVSQLQTDTYTKTQIDTKLIDGSVTKVQTVSGTFDVNGMTYEKSDAPTKTTINEVGVNVKDQSNNSVLFAGYVDNNNTEYTDYKGQTIVATDNIIVKHYLVMGSHSRLEDYENGTGIFYV